MHVSIRATLDKFKKEDDKYQKRERKRLISERRMPESLVGKIQIKLSVPPQQRNAFCHMHTTIQKHSPEGGANGYPEHIDLESFPERIKSKRKGLRVLFLRKSSIFYKKQENL